MVKKTEGGVTAAKGFSAASAAARIKYQGRTDMAMIFSASPCTAAGTFTRNVVKAAPVIWDRDRIRENQPVHAVVVNSGIANACTGREGLEYCRQTAEAAGALLQVPADSVLVGSTGVIGFQLPMDRIRTGIEALVPALGDSLSHGTDAARAIMTTDTHKKECACTVEIGGKTVTVGGMSKGSGMIHPDMCTMLAYVTTDAAVSQPVLQKAVSAIVEETFNMISVDGDTSTNDTLLVLANGEAGNTPVTEAAGADYEALYEALRAVCRDLAMQMAGDGEGATKLIECTVTGMDTLEHARTLAKSVITSSLTKAAVYGSDANWGRILCALGYAGVDFDPNDLQLYFVEDAAGTAGNGGVPEADSSKKMLIFTDGAAADYSEEEATALLKKEKVTILAQFHMGAETATAWGCDLTYDYVRINADYRS
ncbi:MAG: bifunctional glutamate N-acetyltransferase/amino-acid acetyltransferase ArgJ [Eubacteriales bacterium]|nr:bifunctional glutamate N-acetyltransferase/amino-acid acetyltransferase ArgJ [Eubacteriales bacterium]